MNIVGEIQGWQMEDNTRVLGVGRAERGRAGNSQEEAEGLGLMQGLESCPRIEFHASHHQEIIDS